MVPSYITVLHDYLSAGPHHQIQYAGVGGGTFISSRAGFAEINRPLLFTTASYWTLKLWTTSHISPVVDQQDKYLTQLRHEP